MLCCNAKELIHQASVRTANVPNMVSITRKFRTITDIANNTATMTMAICRYDDEQAN